MKKANNIFLNSTLFLLLLCLQHFVNAQVRTEKIELSHSSFSEFSAIQNYDTIYTPLDREVGPIIGINGLDSLFYVYKKDGGYGYIIVHGTKNKRANNGSIFDSLVISKPIYDSIYWKGSIGKLSSWSKNKQETYRSLLFLEKDEKIGLLFLYWAHNRDFNSGHNQFVGILSSSCFEPKYENVKFGRNLILKEGGRYGILFSNESIVHPQYDSIHHVSVSRPYDQYYYVWKNNKCGLMLNGQLKSPILYRPKEVLFHSSDIMALVKNKEPFTLFFIEDSIYVNIKNNNEFVLNSDAYHISSGLEYKEGDFTILELYRNRKVAKSNADLYMNRSQIGGVDEIYLVNKEKNNTVAVYADENSKYRSFGSIVIQVKSKKGKRNQFEIILFNKFQKLEIHRYNWTFDSSNELIELMDEYQDENGRNYVLFGYFKSNGDFKKEGYLNLDNGVFKSKID